MSERSSLTRDEELELRVADWLQDGPFVAPAASVDAILGRVHRAPRRHPTLARLRRVVLGTPPGDALEIGAQPRTKHWLAAAASLIVSVSLLVTFGVTALAPPAATSRPSPTIGASPSPSRTVNPTGSPSPLPSLPLETTEASTCSEMDAGTESRVGTSRVTTGIVMKCSDRSSDPRLTGLGYRYYTVEVAADRSQRWYGTATNVNADGEWNGVWTGYQAPNAVVLSNTTFWLGAGAYAGLQARAWVEIGDNGITFPRPGILEVVGALGSTGLAACTSASSRNEGTTLTCVITSAEDPRLSGSRSLVVTVSKRGDGSSGVSGSDRIENDAGIWDGQVSGSIDADGRTWHLDESLAGSGLYAGFTYDGRLQGTIGALVATGTVAPVP